jgi:hypothetical protein
MRGLFRLFVETYLLVIVPAISFLDILCSDTAHVSAAAMLRVVLSESASNVSVRSMGFCSAAHDSEAGNTHAKQHSTCRTLWMDVIDQPPSAAAVSLPSLQTFGSSHLVTSSKLRATRPRTAISETRRAHRDLVRLRHI